MLHSKNKYVNLQFLTLILLYLEVTYFLFSHSILLKGIIQHVKTMFNVIIPLQEWKDSFMYFPTLFKWLNFVPSFISNLKVQNRLLVQQIKYVPTVFTKDYITNMLPKYITNFITNMLPKYITNFITNMLPMSIIIFCFMGNRKVMMLIKNNNLMQVYDIKITEVINLLYFVNKNT